MPPPATANIKRQSTNSVKPPSTSSDASPPPPSPLPALDISAEFAPNAFEAPSQYAPANVPQQHGWLDRVVNALLGEDETRPDRRLALICTKCRLVNGLASPGMRTLEEVGRWRCSSCGSWNGIELPILKQDSPNHSRSSSIAVPDKESVTEKENDTSKDE
jgi:hypothetical protein